MKLLYGKPIADQILSGVREMIREYTLRPGLAVVMVGDNPASEIYVGLKEKAAQSVGMYFEKHVLPSVSDTQAILNLIDSLNARADIHGIIVQLPLPKGFDTDAIIQSIHPSKDADGFHPETVERFLSGATLIPPVFPRAIVELVKSTGISLVGKQAFIYANSDLFSRVMTVALQSLKMRVQNNRRSDESAVSRSDVIVTAIGEPRFLKSVHVQQGVVIIDGGITRVGEVVLGDVDIQSFQTMEGMVTPVPGGVGPVTVACLIRRVVELALGRADERVY